MDIKNIDKNFKINSANESEYDFFPYRSFTVEGFCKDGAGEKELVRLPKAVLKNLSPALNEAAHFCAGGVVRLRTDSSKIAVRCNYNQMRNSSGMPLSADAGIDLYSGLKFIANYRPEDGNPFIDMEASTESEQMCDYTMYLPLYSNINELEIGLLKGSKTEKAAPHKSGKTILFYGSSVTNGGCASRPGLTYPAVITRKMGAEMINLGFSGNARGELEIAEYIARLDVSAVIIEYDHNAPTAQFLKETHEPFFKTVRDAKPNVPIILISGWFFRERSDDVNRKIRRDIVKQTMLNAVNSGDKAVYFIDGSKLFPRETCTDFSADCIHPNDTGFGIMAEKITDILKNL